MYIKKDETMLDFSLGYQLATVFFGLFVLLGAFDGIYFHIYKYKLHLHPQAKLEHQIHTFRGLLFLPITLLFFILNSAGSLLWIGIALLIIDFIAELIDILVEKQARAELGGISPVESAIHVTATGFRMSALAIIITLKPIDAFVWSASTYDFATLPSYLQWTGIIFLTGLIIAISMQTIVWILTKQPFAKAIASRSSFLFGRARAGGHCSQ
jgi:hypothetical protein